MRLRLLIVVLFIVPAAAQAPAFDAVSIKVNNSGETAGRFGGQPGRLMVTNNTLRNIIRNVWNISAAQIVGGPEWIAADRFDIMATAPGTASRDDMIAMAKTMLADRFKLKTRMETRQVPIYALVMARADGRLGPMMRPSTLACNAPPNAGGPPAEPPAPLGGIDIPRCGTNLQAGTMRAGGIELEALARRLTEGVERIVVNKTGLSGPFDVVLKIDGDSSRSPAENAASMFTAIQEQLGLKFEPQTGPAEVLVIESAEKPTEN